MILLSTATEHCLLQIFRNFGFRVDFVSWIKTILKNHESCIINGGKTTKYFKLERGARQGDLIAADNTTFFLKYRKSIRELMNELNTFSNFSGLKPNKTKCEIVGIGVLNGVQVALCGIKCVNLNNETLKILRVHFSYNKNLDQDINFCEYIVKIENILRLWRMRQLTLVGRITVFKTLVVSKVIIFY